MNKLPWFTHSNRALSDEWHQTLIDEFGFEGYGRWWALTELFDLHGTGDSWKTTMTFLARQLRAKPVRVRHLLDSGATGGRIYWTHTGNEVEIRMEKFRKIQAKLKSKARSILPQDSSIHPKSKSKSKIEEKDNYLPQTPKKGAAVNGHKAPPTQQQHQPRQRTPLQVFMDGIITDYLKFKPGDPDPKQRKAVAESYRRFGRSARALLAFAMDDPVRARKGVDAIGKWLSNKDLSWTLDTCVKWFPDWMSNPRSFDATPTRRF